MNHESSWESDDFYYYFPSQIVCTIYGFHQKNVRFIDNKTQEAVIEDVVEITHDNEIEYVPKESVEHETNNDDDDDDTNNYVDDDSIEWRLGQSKLAGNVL